MNPLIPTEISKLRQLSSRANSNTLDLGLGKPSEDMPAELRLLLPEILTTAKLEYSENAGFAELRELLAHRYGGETNEYIITNGAQGALMAALTTILSANTEVLVPNPGFPAYSTIVQMLGAQAKTYALDVENHTFSYNLNTILSFCTPATRVVVLTTPNNPTSSLLSTDQLHELARSLAAKNIYLLLDEVYAELIYAGYVSVKTCLENVIRINSFSKSLALTGWRIGWLHTTNPEVYRRALVVHQYTSTCANVPAQRLMINVLRDHGNLAEQIINKYRTEYANKLQLFSRNLKTLTTKLPNVPEAGFYWFLPIPEYFANDWVFIEQLLEKNNLLVIPGSIFGTRGKNYFRISVATSESTVEQAANILAKYY